MILLRQAKRGDVEVLLAILRRAFAPYRQHYTEEAFEATVLNRTSLTERLEEMNVIVAEQDGMIVGTISWFCVGHEGHIRGMAVEEAARGSGVAAELLGGAEVGALGRGCSFMTLDTAAVLTRAIGFYEKMGYRVTGTTTQFHGIEIIEYRKELT